MRNIFFTLTLFSLFFTTTIDFVKAQSRIGQDYALFFAVSDYEEGYGLTDLTQPIKNAEDIAYELENRYGFQTEIVKNPSFEEIQTKLSEYEQKYIDGVFPKDGQLFIFFSGHGIKDHNNGYFLPNDVNPDKVYLKGLAYNIWRPIINDFNCNHILVAVDACYSVTFDPNWESKSGIKDRFRRKNESSESERLLLNHKSHKSRLFFTSDSQEDITPGRSNFARKLLIGLADHYSPSGFMTAEELFAGYIKKATPTPNAGDFGADDPRSGFFFFVKTTTNLNDARADRSAWQKALEANTIMSYRRYPIDFPNGEFRDLAQEKLKILEQEEREQLAWDQAKSKNTKAAYTSFINSYPNSPYKAIAVRNMENLTETEPVKTSFVVKKPALVQIPRGQFRLGDEYGEEDAKPPVTVHLSTFLMAPYELTFEEYDLFCEATGRQKPSDNGWGRANRPVINVSWHDAISYCNWLSEQTGFTPVYDFSDNKNMKADFSANGYRLPTEIEWEYAATYTTNGSEARFGNGKSTADSREMNFDGSEKGAYSVVGPNRKKTVEVGSLRNSSNALKIYDLSGNVREWCWDSYSSNEYTSMAGSIIIIVGTTSLSSKSPNSRKVLRGGAFDKGATEIQTYIRRSSPSSYKYRNIGFRLVQSVN